MNELNVSAALAWAHEHVGATESPAGSNHVFVWDDYREQYGPNFQGSPWCGAFVLDALHHGGYQAPADWIGVAAIEAYGRRNNTWHDGFLGVDAGDVLVLLGHGVHCGIATGPLRDGTVPTVEGNTIPQNGAGAEANGGGIYERERDPSQVIGYVRIPKAQPAVQPAPKPAATVPPVVLTFHAPELHTGSTGPAVRTWQGVLIARGHTVTVDGDFGPNTHAATLALQADAGITRDGIVGPHTWTAGLAA